MKTQTVKSQKSEIAQTEPEFVVIDSRTGAAIGTVRAKNAVVAFLAARRDLHMPTGIRVKAMPTDAAEVTAIRTAAEVYEAGIMASAVADDTQAGYATETVQTHVPEPKEQTMPRAKTTAPAPKPVTVAKSAAKAPAPRAAVRQPVAKPAAVKAAAPAPAKPAAKAAVAESNGHTTRGGPRKEGLRKPQVRILKALLASKGPLSRRRIAEAISKDPSRLTDVGEPIGSVNVADRPAQDERLGYRTLLSLGYVRFKDIDVSGHAESVYELTAEGRKAAQKASDV